MRTSSVKLVSLIAAMLMLLLLLPACADGASTSADDPATATPAASIEPFATDPVEVPDNNPDGSAEDQGDAGADVAASGDRRDLDCDRPAAALPPSDRADTYDALPDTMIDAGASYQATFATDAGDIVVELFADRAPVTVNNFVFLACEGYYDGTTFHRVIDSFMAQGGDPTARGTGGPGYVFADEFDESLRFDRPGLLAMANAGPGTNGSQFFITFVPTPHLNDLHTIFGEVIEGSEVLDQITRTGEGPDTTLLSVTISVAGSDVAASDDQDSESQAELQTPTSIDGELIELAAGETASRTVQVTAGTT